jgi:hypothetical protein
LLKIRISNSQALRVSVAYGHGFAISPHHSREVCSQISRSLNTEGAGNAGRPMRPQPRVVCSKHAR